jgi:hypothetical protein
MWTANLDPAADLVARQPTTLALDEPEPAEPGRALATTVGA